MSISIELQPGAWVIGYNGLVRPTELTLYEYDKRVHFEFDSKRAHPVNAGIGFTSANMDELAIKWLRTHGYVVSDVPSQSTIHEYYGHTIPYIVYLNCGGGVSIVVACVKDDGSFGVSPGWVAYAGVVSSSLGELEAARRVAENGVKLRALEAHGMFPMMDIDTYRR